MHDNTALNRRIAPNYFMDSEKENSCFIAHIMRMATHVVF